MRRYHQGINYVKVATVQQLDFLLKMLDETVDRNGKSATPFHYADGYEAMRTTLTEKAPPVITVSLSESKDVVTVRGRTWPLEEFFNDLHFVRDGDTFTFVADDTDKNAAPAAHAEILDLATTFGWHVEVRHGRSPTLPCAFGFPTCFMTVTPDDVLARCEVYDADDSDSDDDDLPALLPPSSDVVYDEMSVVSPACMHYVCKYMAKAAHVSDV